MKNYKLTQKEYFNILKHLSGNFKKSKIISLGNIKGSDQIEFFEFKNYISTLYGNNPFSKRLEF